MSETPVRYVKVKGVKYLRLEDVVRMIREIGETEEVDVRNRFEECFSGELI